MRQYRCYKIFDVNGVRVAVIGLANAKPTRPTEKYTFTDPLAALEKVLPEVEKQKPNVVAVLVHDSLADDRPGRPFYVGEIGRRFSGRVHVVLGGHAHKIFSNKYIKDVLFVEDGAHLQFLGKVVITTDDKTGEFVAAESFIIPLDIAKTGEDKGMAAYAQSLKEPGMDEVLGQTADALPKRSAKAADMDGAAENWIADVARAYAMNVITGTDDDLYETDCYKDGGYEKAYCHPGSETAHYTIRLGSAGLRPRIDSDDTNKGEAMPAKTALIVELDLDNTALSSDNSLEGDQVWDWDEGDESMGFNHEDNGAMFAHVCFADGHVESIRDPSADPEEPDDRKRQALSKWYGSGGLNASGEKLD